MFKKQSPHLPAADHPCDLPESKERQEQDKAHGTHRQQTLRIPPKHRWQAIRNGMSMPHSHHHALYDVKRNEHHGEDEAFMQDRIDERLMAKPRSKMKMFSGEQHLCENERVNERKCVLLVIQMTLLED